MIYNIPNARPRVHQKFLIMITPRASWGASQPPRSSGYSVGIECVQKQQKKLLYRNGMVSIRENFSGEWHFVKSWSLVISDNRPCLYSKIWNQLSMVKENFMAWYKRQQTNKAKPGSANKTDLKSLSPVLSHVKWAETPCYFPRTDPTTQPLSPIPFEDYGREEEKDSTLCFSNTFPQFSGSTL